MGSIYQDIIGKLTAIETEHNVCIPLAVESGSRAWGFASPDSDYDCRFVYVRPRDAYLTVFPMKDTIDYTPDAIFDVCGWDVRKFIEHLVKSNAVTLEWLRSGIAYRRDDLVWQELWSLGEMYFDPVKASWHYLSMARNKLAEITSGDVAKIKRYFYVMRPLACVRFIRKYQVIPHMEYRKNLAEIDVPGDIIKEINALMAEKENAKEAQPMARNETLLAYFSREISLAEEWLSSHTKLPARDTKPADECFRKIAGIVYGD